MKSHPELFTKHPSNPILKPADWPYPINAVFNAGAVMHGNLTTLLCRVEDKMGVSHLALARSPNGVSKWTIDTRPTIEPEPSTHPEEEWGIEDPRITPMDDENTCAITYTSYSFRGPCVSLATTSDFSIFRRHGVILPPENKNAAIFPRKIKGKYWLLHRPVSREANIWIGSSPDMIHWSDHAMLMRQHAGALWDADRIGPCGPPIETAEGWLLAFHGAKQTACGHIYRIGLALLDLEDPRRVIRRAREWVLSPTAPFERWGDVPNVVFSCGWILDPSSQHIRLYYGGSDSAIGLATTQVSDALEFLKKNPQ